MKQMKRIMKVIIILVLGIIIAFLAMAASYMLPTDKIKENVKESISTFYKEKTYSNLISKFDGTKLDNYTDAIMLSAALYGGPESPIEKAMKVYMYVHLDKSTVDQLVAYFVKKVEDPETFSYARYWHGYLIVLKPILMVFDYMDIRMFNEIFQLVLLALIVFLSVKRKIDKYILPFIIAISTIGLSVVSMSLQYSSVTYITLISIIVLLIFYEKLKSRYIYFFLIIGMLTSFFDLLTFPLLTLGMPLMFAIILNKNDWKKDIKDILLFSLMWGIGYVGMWFGKWIIGSIFLQENLFNDAFNKIGVRMSNVNGIKRFSNFDVIKVNLENIIIPSNIIMMIGYFIFLVCFAIKQKFWKNKIDIVKIIPFILVASIPFVWAIVISNHTYVHEFYAYRIFAIAVFAILSGVTMLLLDGKEKVKS